MRSLHRILIPLFSVFLFAASLRAQDDDNGVLYYPPEIDVTLWSVSGNSWSRGFDEPADAVTISLSRERNAIALLPMIFFESGSPEIARRYATFERPTYADSWSDSASPWYSGRYVDDVVDRKYYDILNVIGYRLRKYPDARLALEGGYSTLPGESAELARLRCEVVRDYLVTIWRIDPVRITIDRPRRMCDSAANVFVQEEAQRVECTASDRRVLDVVEYVEESASANEPGIEVTLRPMMRPEEVAGIEVRMYLDNSLAAIADVPASPDSAYYRIYGRLVDFNPSTRATALGVETVIRSVDGELRTSNRVTFPIETHIDDYTTYGYWNFHDPDPWSLTGFEIPFFASGGTDVALSQALLMANRIERINFDPDDDLGDPAVDGAITANPMIADAEATAAEHEDEYDYGDPPLFLAATGIADFSEDRFADPVEYASIHSSFRLLAAQLEKLNVRTVPPSHRLVLGFSRENVNWEFYRLDDASEEDRTDVLVKIQELSSGEISGERLDSMKALERRRGESVARLLRPVIRGAFVDTIVTFPLLPDRSRRGKKSGAIEEQAKGDQLAGDTTITDEAYGDDGYDISPADYPEYSSSYYRSFTPEGRYYARSVWFDIRDYVPGEEIDEYTGQHDG